MILVLKCRSSQTKGMGMVIDDVKPSRSKGTSKKHNLVDGLSVPGLVKEEKGIIAIRGTLVRNTDREVVT